MPDALPDSPSRSARARRGRHALGAARGRRRLLRRHGARLRHLPRRALLPRLRPPPRLGLRRPAAAGGLDGGARDAAGRALAGRPARLPGRRLRGHGAARRRHRPRARRRPLGARSRRSCSPPPRRSTSGCSAIFSMNSFDVLIWAGLVRLAVGDARRRRSAACGWPSGRSRASASRTSSTSACSAPASPSGCCSAGRFDQLRSRWLWLGGAIAAAAVPAARRLAGHPRLADAGVRGARPGGQDHRSRAARLPRRAAEAGRAGRRGVRPRRARLAAAGPRRPPVARAGVGGARGDRGVRLLGVEAVLPVARST